MKAAEWFGRKDPRARPPMRVEDEYGERHLAASVDGWEVVRLVVVVRRPTVDGS